MKTRYYIMAAAIVASVAAASLLKYLSHWRVERDTDSELVLSLDGSSNQGVYGKLQIRCSGGKTETRLYVPISKDGGPSRLLLSEAFQDAKGNAIPGESASGQSNGWAVARQEDFATRSNPAAFINRLLGSEWFNVSGLAQGGNGVSSEAVIGFKVRGLASYREKMSAVCGLAG